MNAMVILFMLLCETWIFGCQSEIIVEDIAAILLRLETVEKKVESLEEKVESLEVENKQLKDALEKCTTIPNSDDFQPEQIAQKVTSGNEGANQSSKTQNNIEKRLLLGTPDSTSRIAFRAFLSTPIINLGTHQTIEYNEVPLNIGNGYDSRHGHFTAPVNGLYIIYASAFAIPGQMIVLSILHNGNSIDVLHADGRPAHYSSVTKVNPLMMNQGDMVWLIPYPSYDGQQLHGLGSHNMFAGVLLFGL